MEKFHFHINLLKAKVQKNFFIPIMRYHFLSLSLHDSITTNDYGRGERNNQRARGTGA